MAVQLSIFDALEAIQNTEVRKPKLIVLHVDHEKQILGPVDRIEKIRSYEFESDNKLLKIKADFYKVNDIDFYSSLIFEFPKSAIRSEYNLTSEMSKKHRFATLYLCKKDVREYLEMRFGSFLGMNDGSFSAHEKWAIREFLPPTSSFYENLKSTYENI